LRGKNYQRQRVTVRGILVHCDMSYNTLCILDSGVKSGALLQLLGQPASGSTPSILALTKTVFDLANQGNAAALLVALQVWFCTVLKQHNFVIFVFVDC
jgi:hypothetical protein